jgi:hypothetical protein
MREFISTITYSTTDYENNQYLNKYISLIEDNLSNTKSFKDEKHHILPESLGGSRKKDNLVYLSPSDHLKAHFLLIKFTHNKPLIKMLYAIHMLYPRLINNPDLESEIQKFSIQFEEARLKHRQYLSELNKGKPVVIWTEELKEQSKLTRINNLRLGMTSPIKRTLEQNEANRLRNTGKVMSKESSIKKSNAMKGRILTEKHKEKISKTHIGKSIISKNNKSIFCIELNKLYPSLSQASKDLDIPISTLRNQATRQSKKSSSGYHFKFL